MEWISGVWNSCKTLLKLNYNTVEEQYDNGRIVVDETKYF
jgi:hypothetical protein